jgi:pimeloyl-ACP methyl ester carboxylesterase
MLRRMVEDSSVGRSELCRRNAVALDGPDAGTVLAYLDWGAPNPAWTVVCVHGLTRNAHDFDKLAQALAERGARVLAFDVAGRGRSSWLADANDYRAAVYARQLGRALALLGLGAVDWVGTSMGGLIGMAIAAGQRSPIRRLVLNDIGPLVPQQAIRTIQSYVGLDPEFASLAEAEAHLRHIHAPFGPLSDAQWRHLAEHSVRADGARLRLHYDPRIAQAFAELAAADIDLWEQWERIHCPVLVLRGERSELLTSETFAAMLQRGPPATGVTFPAVGHAPALMAQDQIAVVADWLAPAPG